MNEPKLPSYRPPRVDDFTPPRLEDYYQPTTPQEQAGLATAYARRNHNRLFRRVIRKQDRRIEAMKAEDAIRRRFGPRR